MLAAGGACGMFLGGGCAALDRGYGKAVVSAPATVVTAVTNPVVSQVEVPVVSAGAGGVTVTNYVDAWVTNRVVVLSTNVVSVPVTNLVALPAVDAGIRAAGSVVDLLVPGIGSLAALALGGVYHVYCQVRNKRVNEALVQGVETARAVLTTTPQGQAVDAQFVKWLMDHQKAAGVFAAVSTLVDQVSDNPAAKMTAQEIAERAQEAQEQRAAGA
jgi:hypothetical protein